MLISRECRFLVEHINDIVEQLPDCATSSKEKFLELELGTMLATKSIVFRKLISQTLFINSLFEKFLCMKILFYYYIYRLFFIITLLSLNKEWYYLERLSFLRIFIDIYNYMFLAYFSLAEPILRMTYSKLDWFNDN